MADFPAYPYALEPCTPAAMVKTATGETIYPSAKISQAMDAFKDLPPPQCEVAAGKPGGTTIEDRKVVLTADEPRVSRAGGTPNPN